MRAKDANFITHTAKPKPKINPAADLTQQQIQSISAKDANFIIEK
jgi:hypothetical protein